MGYPAIRMHRRVLALVVFAVTLAPVARSAGDATPRAHEPTPSTGTFACRSPEWRAARRAVGSWCEGEASVVRRYYGWSLTHTKRRACAELRAAFERCGNVLRNLSLDGEEGRFIVVDYPGSEATYWQVGLDGDGRTFRIIEVDFYEDCTGP